MAAMHYLQMTRLKQPDPSTVLGAVGQILKVASQTSAVQVMMSEVCERLADLYGCEASSVWAGHELPFLIGTDLDRERLQCVGCFGPVPLIGYTVARDGSRVGEAASCGQPRIDLDLQTSKQYASSVDASTGFVTHSLVSFPVKASARVLAVFQLVNTHGLSQGAQSTLIDSLEHFAAALAPILLMFNHAEGRVVDAKLQKDLALAREVQTALLPSKFPDWIWGQVVPFSELSGDFFSWKTMSETHWFVFGDVAGKGVAASLSMARYLAVFHECVSMGLSLAQTAHRLSQFAMHEPKFCTLVLGTFDVSGCHWISFGHGELFFVTDKQTVITAQIQLPPLGVDPYDETRIQEAIGQTPANLTHLVIASDGLTETRGNGPARPFEAQIEQAMTMQLMSPDALGRHLLSERINGPQTSHDDTSIVVIHCAQQPRINA